MSILKRSESAAEQESHHGLLSRGDKVDRWGATLGIICAIHCALMPFSVVLMPIFGLGALWTERGEILLLTAALTFTFPSIISAKKLPSGRRIMALFFVSWAALALSIIAEHNAHIDHETEHASITEPASHHDHKGSEHHHTPLSVTLAVLGGLGLAGAHLSNLKERREAHKSCCSHA